MFIIRVHVSHLMLVVLSCCCSANSIPTLRKLEGLLVNLGDDVEVVSIHSPKYDGESTSAAVEEAIRKVEVSRQWPR